MITDRGLREQELHDVADFAERAWKVRREIARELVAHWEVSGETYAAMLRSGPLVTSQATSPYQVIFNDGPELQLFGIRVARRFVGYGRLDLVLVVSA